MPIFLLLLLSLQWTAAANISSNQDREQHASFVSSPSMEIYMDVVDDGIAMILRADITRGTISNEEWSIQTMTSKIFNLPFALFSLIISTSKHSTSALTALFLLSAPLSTDAGSKNCDAAFSCADQTISKGDTVWGYGYKSLFESKVTNTYCYNSCVGCRGGYSCASAVDLYAKNMQGGQLCQGASSCINAERIYGGIAMSGLSAGTNTTLFASSSNSDGISCSGDHSCNYATMSVHATLTVNGAYALFGSTIVSADNINVYLQAHYAGYGATLTCDASDNCKIYCYGTGCAGFFVDCQGTCTITLGTLATAPLTDLSQLSDVEQDTIYTIDVVSLAESVESDCNTLPNARTFDDNPDNYPIADVIVPSGEGPVCCRGSNACREAVITTLDAVVTCQGTSGCKSSNIESDAAVLCIAYYACQTANVTTSETLYCVAQRACYEAKLTAPAIYCTASQGLLNS